MSQRSRGCLRCRQRRVKCDRGRPSCQRCLTRDEVCVGYRDEADLMFQNETDKVIARSRSRTVLPLTPASSASSRSRSHSLPRTLQGSESPPNNGTVEFADVDEDAAVSGFFNRYVVNPCTERSTPGFLEHLPCLFKEVNIRGRHALRWAVTAAAYADSSRGSQSRSCAAEAKALDCYGRALAALGESLAEKGKIPDDYDLMAVCILDIFETLFMPESASPDSHAQGMAMILRLRGYQQFHDARGWSLFQLAHHRLQKQQMARKLSPLPESSVWLDSLDQSDSFVHQEQDALSVSKLCDEANIILSQLDSCPSRGEVMPLVRRMHQLDNEATAWRQKPEWHFRTISASEISGYYAKTGGLPAMVHIYPDIWAAYEWNYHRAARIVLHHQLLTCLEAISAAERTTLDTDEAEIMAWQATSKAIVRALADEVLSTVAQSFGDIDHRGRCTAEAPRTQPIGAYFLLWPIKMVKGLNSSATEAQKHAAHAVFERIRDCTGMKRELGALSIV